MKKKKNVTNSAPKKTVSKKETPKKNIEPPKPKTKMIATKQGLVEVEIKEEEKKKDNRKYVKVYDNDPPEKCKEIGERVFRKEIKFAYYASEGAHGVRYYVVL